MTDGQALAKEQIQEIETASDSTLSVDYIEKPTDGDSKLRIGVSIKCGSYPQKEGGLKYRERETFKIIIGPNFPFKKPSILTTHTRFAGFPHVLWKRQLCLYLSPDIEWLPNDGMFGFIERLKRWLEKAALNELDPEGAPLHPPVTYTSTGKTRTIVVRENTPNIGDRIWSGFAQIRHINDDRFDVVGWESDENLKASSDYVGAALLLNEPMPFEFPTTIKDLFIVLGKRGVPASQIFFLLQIAVLNNNKNLPIILILGTPIGTSIEREIKHHLTAWYINKEVAAGFRLCLNKFLEDPEKKKIGENVERILWEDWVPKASINWCHILEDRKEITMRRDQDSPMSVFKDLNVEIWGCGALGANVALSLARANVRRLKLIDNGVVKPGLLVRQPFFESDIGRPKVLALHDHIKRIDPKLEVKIEGSNIVESILTTDKIDSEADVIFDCTASNSVRYKLDLSRKKMSGIVPDICSMLLDANAKHAAVVFTPSGYTGGPGDIYRKTKIEIQKYPVFKPLMDSFFSDESDDDLFQPEPGCSSPTFIASAADVNTISNALLNIVAESLKNSTKTIGKSFFIKQPRHVISEENRDNIVEKFVYEEDFIQVDPLNGYEVRYSKNAIRDLHGYVNKNVREGNKESETGGILWGELDEVLKVIWVTDVSGPPPDSTTSPSQFVCGTEGVAEMNEKKKENSFGSVSYLGIWHTHPKSEPLPSEKDYNAVYNLLNDNELSTKKVFITIIGSLDAETSIGSYVFEKDNFFEIAASYD